MDERYFGYLIVFLMGAIGFGVTLSGEPSPSGRVGSPSIAGREGGDVTPAYQGIQGLDAAALIARRRVREVAAVVSGVSPATTKADWIGVVIHDVSAAPGTADEFLARLRATATEEGAPLHFVFGRAGAVVAAGRWSRQRPWRQPGLPQDSRWIIVHSLAGLEPPGRAGLLLEGLCLPSVSRGGFATVDADGLTVLVTPPRR